MKRSEEDQVIAFTIASFALNWARLKREVAAARAGRSPMKCDRMRSSNATSLQHPKHEDPFVYACRREPHPEDGGQSDPSTWCQPCRDAEASHALYHRLVPKLRGAEARLRRACDPGVIFQ